MEQYLIIILLLLAACSYPSPLPVDTPAIYTTPAITSSPVSWITSSPAAIPTPAPMETALVTRIIDGDTIVLESGERVRYIGIDTPERGEPWYREAKYKNADLVLGKTIKLEKDRSERDRYKRLLRYIYVDDTFVNAELVRLGLAKARYYKPDGRYRLQMEALEMDARASSLGIWGASP